MSQLVSPFGPGAIFNILGESFIVEDTSKWGKGKLLKSVRLENILGKDSITEPPTGKRTSRYANAKGVSLLRFPRWLFCPMCRKLKFWDYQVDETGNKPVCDSCRNKVSLVPMRFVQVCNNGHMSDVDWSYFVHARQKQINCKSKNLLFKNIRGRGGGLDSLQIECRDCGLAKTLGEITHKDYMKRIGVSCSGKQPWQHLANMTECDETPQVLQKGASNVYFPRIMSALDLPPESFFTEEDEVKEQIKDNLTFQRLSTIEKKSALFDPLLKAVATTFDVEESYVMRLISNSGDNKSNESLEISDAEWLAFNKIYEFGSLRDKHTFITEHVKLLDEQLKNDSTYKTLNRLIDKVVIARRLREVRALTGYQRYTPEGDLIKPSFSTDFEKYPGLEVFGEGIFITLNEEVISEWEKLDSIVERADGLKQKKEISIFESWLPEVTPRFILLHTFAHLLIRQMAFESGYSSASLRERIYASDNPNNLQAGILIYTASGDSEGTLGGLARKGESPNLAKTIISALRTSSWCSNDPICMEMEGQGIDDLNKAACHACALVSETSCIYNNTLLDRGFLFGDDKSIKGFFKPVLDGIFNS
jgi:hypothetical protein